MIRPLPLALLLLPLLATLARADDTLDLNKLAPQIAKSLVLIEYTIKNENTSSEQYGQGIVLNKEGVILVSGTFIPETLPHEWITRLKIRTPGQHFEAVSATFLGRTANHAYAFIKADAPIDSEPLDFSKTAPSKLGQAVYSVGIEPKSGNYAITATADHVKTIFCTTHEVARTEAYGLTRANSPVFDAATGNLVGLTIPSLGNNVVLRLGENFTPVEIKDEDQPGFYITIEDVKASFSEIPTKPFQVQRPWMGVEGVSGVDEDLRKDYKIEQPACVTIGAVIPGAAAEKAGLKPQDVILTINGKEFSDAPVPEFVPAQFSRTLEHFIPGDKITFGIVRRVDPDKTADHSGLEKKDIELTIGIAPPNAAEMPHTFDGTVGITTRDLVFTDIYARHLPPDQKGVIVAMVKHNSPAFISDTSLHPGHLITKINDQDVTSNEQFGKLLKAAEADPANKQILFLVIKPEGGTSVCRIDLTATPSSHKTPGFDLPGTSAP